MRGSGAILAFSVAGYASACSVRPGSMIIFENEATTLIAAWLAMLFAFFAYRRDLPAAKRACLGLLIVHPCWTLIGSCCDCGSTQMFASVLDTFLSGSIYVWDALRRRVE